MINAIPVDPHQVLTELKTKPLLNPALPLSNDSNYLRQMECFVGVFQMSSFVWWAEFIFVPRWPMLENTDGEYNYKWMRNMSIFSLYVIICDDLMPHDLMPPFPSNICTRSIKWTQKPLILGNSPDWKELVTFFTNFFLLAIFVA